MYNKGTQVSGSVQKRWCTLGPNSFYVTSPGNESEHLLHIWGRTTLLLLLLSLSLISLTFTKDNWEKPLLILQKMIFPALSVNILKNLILTRVRQEKVHQGYSLFAIPTHFCKIYLVQSSETPAGLRCELKAQLVTEITLMLYFTNDITELSVEATQLKRHFFLHFAHPNSFLQYFAL